MCQKMRMKYSAPYRNLKVWNLCDFYFYFFLFLKEWKARLKSPQCRKTAQNCGSVFQVSMLVSLLTEVKLSILALTR